MEPIGDQIDPPFLAQRHRRHGVEGFCPFAVSPANGQVAHPPSAEIHLSHYTLGLVNMDFQFSDRSTQNLSPQAEVSLSFAGTSSPSLKLYELEADK